MNHVDRVARPQGLDDPRCVFCEVLEEPTSPAMPPHSYNTLLTSSDHFVVLPALGPLVKGHVLVVSRAHMPSLASLGEQASVSSRRSWQPCGRAMERWEWTCSRLSTDQPPIAEEEAVGSVASGQRTAG